MEKYRGVSVTLSDWWNDIPPPQIGMWSNAICHLRNAEALLAAEDLRGAHINLVTGFEWLADAKEAVESILERDKRGSADDYHHPYRHQRRSLRTRVGLLTGGSGLVGGGIVGSTWPVSVRLHMSLPR